MNDDNQVHNSVKKAIEITIRLGILLALGAWCVMILMPFGVIIMWSIILALAFSPLYNTINRKLGDKPKLAAGIIVFFGLMIILLPSLLFVESIIEGVKTLKSYIEVNGLAIPPPPESVAGWPIVGKKFYEFWMVASTNLESLLIKYQNELILVSEKVFGGIISIGSSIFQFLFATIIAGFLLASKQSGEMGRKFFKQLVGERGEEYAIVAYQTVSSVTKGVIGVAGIQAAITGLGFLLAGVPFAGLWAFGVLVFAILQIPNTLIVVPIMIYLFTVKSTAVAIAWTIYLLLAGLSDNVLKPWLLGMGAPVPMPVIFIGVLGGFLFTGFIGMFTGAIVLSLGYKLFIGWIDADELGLQKKQ